MSNYVCSELSNADVNGKQICMVWSENVGSLDSLAITKDDADAISTSLLLIIFGAWTFRQIHNVILRRRY